MRSGRTQRRYGQGALHVDWVPAVPSWYCTLVVPRVFREPEASLLSQQQKGIRRRGAQCRLNRQATYLDWL